MLEEMRRNPSGDWTMDDIVRECRSRGINIAPPRGGGSHWKVWDGKVQNSLTIPARRPLKKVYVRLFVAFVDAMGAEP